MTIHVAIAFDRNYLNPFYALLTSVLLNNNSNDRLHIHTIATGITEEEKKNVQNYVIGFGRVISFYSIDEQLINDFVLINSWTLAVYYRLFFPILISDKVERLIYLDSDTIVIGSLSKLYQFELNEYPLGAVYDNYVKTQPLIGIHTEGEYFNSGILLIDLYKWRKQKISEQAIDYLKSYPENIRFVDQCALNAVLKGNWKKLNERFNVMFSVIPAEVSKSELKSFLSDKVIIHYTLQRPWNMLNKNRLSYLYHFYFRKSPIAKGKNKYVDFSWNKIPGFLKIKLIDFYFDLPVVPKFWRIVKRNF